MYEIVYCMFLESMMIAQLNIVRLKRIKQTLLSIVQEIQRTLVTQANIQNEDFSDYEVIQDIVEEMQRTLVTYDDDLNLEEEQTFQYILDPLIAFRQLAKKWSVILNCVRVKADQLILLTISLLTSEMQ